MCGGWLHLWRLWALVGQDGEAGGSGWRRGRVTCSIAAVQPGEGCAVGRVDVGGLELEVLEAGTASETVLLSHSFLVDHRQFDAQIGVLSDRFRVVAYHHRDHGGSDRASSSYDLARLVRDAEAVIDATDAAPCHFVGLSTGGFVGMRLALTSPRLLRSLTLMDTSGQAEPWPARMKYLMLLAIFGLVGTRPVIGSAMRSMFSPGFLRDPDRQDEVVTWRSRIGANDPQALIRFGRAIFARDDVLESLKAVQVPTLVVVGEQDRALPVARARALAAAIPDARLEIIPDAGHLCTIEQPERVNRALVSFLTDVTRRDD
jgi:3-oxoadipate enol-lactonase